MSMPLPRHNIALTVAYDGSSFLGWQQSIEEILKQTIAQIVQHPIQLQAASRTDRGVHAHGQVVNFFTEKKLDTGKLMHGLNALLPESIAILAAEEKELSFHPTLDAKGKEYRYHVDNSLVHTPTLRHTHWHIPTKLDLDAMQKAKEPFIGTKDFRTFCNQRKNLSYRNTIRTMSEITIDILHYPLITFRLRGDHFLYKMARTIVGTLVDVGLGKVRPEDIAAIIESKKRPHAGITAPAHGLTLYHVFY